MPEPSHPEFPSEETGQDVYELLKQLYPICRSLTGKGVEKTLACLQERLPNLHFHRIKTGVRCFDWTIPEEWNISDAYIIDPEGKKIIDFQKSNLHIVGYSIPIHKKLSLDELQPHLHSLPDQPNAIPYVTSYYEKRWGFCLSHTLRRQLKPGTYEVKINSSLKPGHLTYGEYFLKGREKKEIFFSTYVCHPSLANNELSGPTIATYLALWLEKWKNLKYSYRFIFIPETIGSIAYLSRYYKRLKKRVIAGFNVTCLGDEGQFSFLPSRQGTTLADRIALHVLKYLNPEFKQYSFQDRGSDERQYCSPGIDLPVVSIMRSKYGEYPQYHTSLDNLDFVTPKGLFGGLLALSKAVYCLEMNGIFKASYLCEPQLGKRGLCSTLSTKESGRSYKNLVDLLAYADGKSDLLDIANYIQCPLWELEKPLDLLKRYHLLKPVRKPKNRIF